MLHESVGKRMPEFDEEWGEAFVTTMREHMDQLYESLDAEEDDPAADPVLISGQPFCGCPDCDERERYTLATILILEAAERGEIRLVEVDD